MKLFTTKTGITVLSFILDAIIIITVILKFIALFVTVNDAHNHRAHGESKMVDRERLDNIYYSMTILQ